AHGIELTNPEYVTIENLIVVGGGSTGSGFSLVVCNGGYGIYLLSNTTSGNKHPGITISGVNVSGFFIGVLVDAGISGSASTDGFDGLTLTGTTLSDNICGGFLLQGYHALQHGPVNQSTNLTVTNNIIQRIPGDPHSGNGGVHGSVKTEAWGIDVAN